MRPFLSLRHSLQAVILSALFAFLLGITSTADAQESTALPSNERVDQSSRLSDEDATKLARAAHAKAAAIDALPRFYIRGVGQTWGAVPFKQTTGDRIRDFQTELGREVESVKPYRYFGIFSRDENHFALSIAEEDLDPDENQLLPGYVFWGSRELAGATARRSGEIGQVVLRLNARDMWKSTLLTNPNYMLIGHHQFWWGDNSGQNQHLTSCIPPAVAHWKSLGREVYDGEVCDVLISRERSEQLWISSESGHIRGYAQLYTTDPDFKYNSPEAIAFYNSEPVARIIGRPIKSAFEYSQWCSEHYPNLSLEDRVALERASSDRHAQFFGEHTEASLFIRFRDFREISPGILWPFREDRIQGFQGGERPTVMRTSFEVRQVSTAVDLSGAVQELLPKEGDRVNDERYSLAFWYTHREGMTEEEILALLDDYNRKRQADAEIMARMKAPFETLLGKPAPKLPTTGWVGGERPNLAGKPHLLHCWAVWCGPCKNDLPRLKTMAESGLTIIGLHPVGTEVDRVQEDIEKYELNYPTFLASTDQSDGDSRSIAGYPAGIFPYCILVDAQGNVAAHGGLSENGGEIIAKLQEMTMNATAGDDGK